MQTNAQPCQVIMHPAAGNSHIAIAAMQHVTGRVAARLTGKKSHTIYLLTPEEAARYRRQGGAV
ncbi:hypothetical protein [Vreelandella alkaliphila]|uniref:Uncharacterized protein n=1 Tax=Vreelandella alkaliphila TaxID=272774 RepID=A0A7C9NMZ6_9GAMM|nr:hypothetical protein [Halomonas alkaliphila]NDL70529.1 hypothetical protein [Halomonas alkaliphila]